MAKLVNESYPKELNSDFDFSDLEKEIEEKSKLSTLEDLTGFIYPFPIADGQALYRVIKDDGNNITLQHINIWDAYRANPILLKALKRNDVLRLKRFNDMWAKD